ncbi:MAG TPA: PIG-L family deacetylase [Candidatus Lokiarchaeia archaeon]|nr:PIG-L family deacetylase [Candidatus Lokiarchaeia archaeon]
MNPAFRFFDLDAQNELATLEDFFGDWAGSSEESIVIFSPHDDDALLGAGYLILAALTEQVHVHVIIFNKGDAGYSDPLSSATIVETRKKETKASYQVLGLNDSCLTRLDLPDFSGNAYVGLYKPVDERRAKPVGTFKLLLTFLRQIKATRLVFANGFREHIDHSAVAQTGIFYAPQAGDPVVVDWAEPSSIKTCLEYSVWGAFDPVEVARRSAVSGSLPANLAILASDEMERQVQESLQQFHSQQAIIQGILENRKEREMDGGYIELYMRVDPRPKLDYTPYKEIVKSLMSMKENDE